MPRPVRLRAFRPSDAPALAEAVQETMADMEPWMPWCHPHYGVEEADAWIAQTLAWLKAGTAYELAIVDVDDLLVGACGLNQISSIHRGADLGYWVRTSQMGHGLAVTSARMQAEFGFEALALERIQILVDVENVRSCRVAEKLGAVREGVLHRRLRIRDAQRDCVVYALLNPST